jgi:hypothetical protein
MSAEVLPNQSVYDDENGTVDAACTPNRSEPVTMEFVRPTVPADPVTNSAPPVVAVFPTNVWLTS